MIRFKAGAIVQRFTPAIATMLDAAAWWSLRARVDVDINSVDDSAPGRLPNTLHGRSLAIDFDTAGDMRADLVSLAEWMRTALPAGFDVVFEGDHLHVECDAHRAPIVARPTP